MTDFATTIIRSVVILSLFIVDVLPIGIVVLAFKSQSGYFVIGSFPFVSSQLLYLGLINFIIAIITYKGRQYTHGAYHIAFAFSILYIFIGVTGLAVLDILEHPHVSRDEGVQSISNCAVTELTTNHNTKEKVMGF